VPRKPMTAKISELVKQLSLAAVMDVLPVGLVLSVLEESGKGSRRRRLLPAHLVVYLVILLALHAEASVKENLRLLLEALRRQHGLGPLQVAGASALTRARQRLGREPMERLFRAVAHPLGDETMAGCYYRRWRVVAADGTSLEVQNTAENRERYGIHTNQHGEVGYPAIKAVLLVECGTRIPLAAAVGGEHDDEGGLFDGLQGHLKKDMLLLVDRYYYSFERFKACSEKAGALVWRVKSNLGLKPVQWLEDGSYLAVVRPSRRVWQAGRCGKDEQLTLRVISYQVTYDDGSQNEPIRLVTTLLDPREAPAQELAELYAQRWTEETGLDEIKTHLRGPQRVLRGQLPDLVEQEFYGFLLAYTVVRTTMACAAKRSGVPPGRLSFTHTVRVIQRKLAFPPSHPAPG
jgi:hypothetical protein